MLKLRFKIDKYHLAYKYVLKYFGNPGISLEWAELKRSLVEKYGSYPGFLFFEPTDVGQGLLWFNPGRAIIRDGETVNKIFESIFESGIFKKVLENVWKRWQENQLNPRRSVVAKDLVQQTIDMFEEPTAEENVIVVNN